MSRWRPEPDEERWLDVAARLRGALARDALTERAGGWRGTGPLARIALFVLGCLAAGLVVGILGMNSDLMLLVAGLVAALAGEWLKQGKRLHASGIEEGLCLAGYLMIGLWISGKIGGHVDVIWILVMVATGAASVRLLTPFLAMCAVLAGLEWLDSMQFARAIDAQAGDGITVLLLASAVAAAALAAGSRVFRRPSHDRMLDWLVVVPSVFEYALHGGWGWSDSIAGAYRGGTGRLTACTLLLGLAAAMLATGLRRRRHAPLLAFLGCVACLMLELRFAIGGPTEAWLLLSGLAAIGAGLALDRSLRRGRGGLTSAKLTDREGPMDLLQTMGVAVLAQRGGPEAPPSTAAHEGRFGGGGASGKY
jgi:hypothetical protein